MFERGIVDCQFTFVEQRLAERRVVLGDLDQRHARFGRHERLVPTVEVVDKTCGIRIEDRVSNTWLLVEVHEIVVASQHCLHEIEPRHFAAREVRQAERHDLVDPLRVQQREAPHDKRSPVVTDESRALVTEVVEQGSKVTRQVLDIVIDDIDWSGRVAEPPLVRSDHMVAGSDESRDLIAPGVREIGPLESFLTSPAHPVPGT